MAWRGLGRLLLVRGPQRRRDQVLRLPHRPLRGGERPASSIPPCVECAITGRARTPSAGKVVKATVVLAKGWEPPDELIKELQNHVKKTTAPYKYPAHRRVRGRAAEDHRRQDQAQADPHERRHRGLTGGAWRAPLRSVRAACPTCQPAEGVRRAVNLQQVSKHTHAPLRPACSHCTAIAAKMHENRLIRITLSAAACPREHFPVAARPPARGFPLAALPVHCFATVGGRSLMRRAPSYNLVGNRSDKEADMAHFGKACRTASRWRNGDGIPCVGFGTWKMPDGAVGLDALHQALADGVPPTWARRPAYRQRGDGGQGARRGRHTARGAGSSPRRCGTPTAATTPRRRRSKKSRKKLHLDYVDLYLVHWPRGPGPRRAVAADERGHLASAGDARRGTARCAPSA